MSCTLACVKSKEWITPVNPHTVCNYNRSNKLSVIHNIQTMELFLLHFAHNTSFGTGKATDFYVFWAYTKVVFTAINVSVIFFWMATQREAVNFRQSLYCWRDTKWGILELYSRSLTNKRDLLSTPMASEAIPKAITSKSGNLGTTPHWGIFLCSLNKFPADCL